MESEVPNGWPVGSLFETIKPGETFTKNGMNAIWIKAEQCNDRKVKSNFNAVNTYDGDIEKFSKDDLIYRVECKIKER